MNYKDNSYHCSYQPTKRALELIKEAIKKYKIDIHKSYDLYLITNHIEKKITISSRRDASRVNTTGEIIRVIEWIKENE